MTASILSPPTSNPRPKWRSVFLMGRRSSSQPNNKDNNLPKHQQTRWPLRVLARQPSTSETVCWEEDTSNSNRNNSTTTTSETTPTKSVSWGTIHTRLYNRTVGDHPNVTRGPPLSLDWAYREEPRSSVDEQEYAQAKRRRYQPRGCRTLCATERTLLLLHEFDAQPAQLEAATRQAQLVRLQRNESKKDAAVQFGFQRTRTTTTKRTRQGQSLPRRFRQLFAASAKRKSTTRQQPKPIARPLESTECLG